jgi:hypothetical protein
MSRLSRFLFLAIFALVAGAGTRAAVEQSRIATQLAALQPPPRHHVPTPPPPPRPAQPPPGAT